MLTAVRPVIIAAAVEYTGTSEATTLGIVFTVLDGVGMFGALLAGLSGEIKLSYAFIMAAGMALAAALICLFLRLENTNLQVERPAVSPIASPVDR